MPKYFALLVLLIAAPLFAREDDHEHHMSPVPEPSSVGMLVIGGSALVVAARAFRNRR